VVSFSAFGMGLILSTPIVPKAFSYFDFLQHGQLNSHSIKTAIIVSGLVNYYLNRTILDDNFFAFISALLLGHVVWHKCSSHITDGIKNIAAQVGLYPPEKLTQKIRLLILKLTKSQKDVDPKSLSPSQNGINTLDSHSKKKDNN